MALLKSLIQRLLDSRTTPEEAGHSAMPQEDQVISYGSTTENPGSWTTILSFTAPKDGYAKAVVVGTGKNSAELYCGNMRVSAFAPVDNASINVVMPVRKGASVGLVSTVFRSAALYFVPSIGGGYNILVRRALSCLRPSFNFLPKNSLLAEATGFLTNPIQLFKRRISRLQRQENGFLSSLLATGGSASKGLPRKFCLATGRFGRGAIQQRHLIKAFVFLSQKAGLWPTYYRQTPRAHMPSLFRVSAINSFQTGGALC